MDPRFRGDDHLCCNPDAMIQPGFQTDGLIPAFAGDEARVRE